MGGYLSSSVENTSKPVNNNMTEINNNTKRETVIIPVDPSKQAETAFEWYVKHVHKPENYVYVVHCQELEHPEISVSPDQFVQHYEQAAVNAKKTAQSLLDKYNAKLQDNGLRGEVKHDIGRPGQIVVQAADKYNASMIVMGSRGYGIIRRSVLGSVSEYVIHHTKVPVTIVPKETQSWFF